MLNAIMHIVLTSIIGRSYYFISKKTGSEKLCHVLKDKHPVSGSRNSN